jgi:hypothetical protein
MMALTYEQSSELMNDPVFRGRVKVACLKFADYIFGEAATTPAHSTRIKWAQHTMLMPDASAATVAPEVVMDPAVQQDGAAITDAGLQSATENAINKML